MNVRLQAETTSVASWLVSEAETRRPAQHQCAIAFGGEGNCRKTTLANACKDAYEEAGLTANVIEVDRFARGRAQRLLEGVSGYDPRSFDLAAFGQSISTHELGRDLLVPFYDHDTGTPCSNCSSERHQHRLVPADRLIVVGVFSLRWPEFAGQPTSVYFERKGQMSKFIARMRRDVGTRGYRPMDAIENFVQMERDLRTNFLPFRHQDFDWICRTSPTKYEFCSIGGRL